jgi:ATP-dependent Clp protease protease subunit
MIKRIKKAIKSIIDESEKKEEPKPKEEGETAEKKAPKMEMLFLDPAALGGAEKPEPDLRVMGLFSEVEQEKIDFYLCTYGGSADDMFALYDVINIVKQDTEVHTIGVGKVMSAGVLLLASGTKGKRKIGRNCRVMIHNVAGGSFGILPNMANELEAIERIQEAYIDALVENSKLTKKKLTKMLSEKVNIYLDAEEAVKLGIADIII